MLKNAEEVRQFGTQIDFGKTAADYGRHRAGFPPAFFERLASMGILRPGIRALDLGTGTGTIARGLASRGCATTGLDRSASLMAEAARLDGEAGVTVRYLSASAEETGLPESSFDLVTAGQCWHWFDRPRAAQEARRILATGGRIVIAHFDWIALPGNVADTTEKLIEQHNPKWNLGGGIGLHPRWLADLSIAGFRDLETFSFDLEVPYTHESWRGRIRASAGIGASLAPGAVECFDAELAAMLADKFPADRLHVLHRVFAAIGVAP
ncbi:MAG: class I SAM-dependent methyltransferase [Candidatus Binataceae bacterium]